MLINSYIHRKFDARFLQSETAESSAGNVATWTSVNFGAEEDTRRIYLTVHTRIATASNAIVSATIGGVSATIHAQQSATFVGADQLCGIISAAVPTGTSGTVAVTFSGAPQDPTVSQRLYLGVYRVLNQTGAADDTDISSGTAGATGTRTLDPTVVGGAIICGITGAAGAGASCTWTSAVEDFDNALAGHGSSFCTSAMLRGLAGVTQGYSCAFSASSTYSIVGVAIH
jgi:hypothetical protein